MLTGTKMLEAGRVSPVSRAMGGSLAGSDSKTRASDITPKICQGAKGGGGGSLKGSDHQAHKGAWAEGQQPDLARRCRHRAGLVSNL